MTIRCPKCSEATLRTKLRQPFHLTPGVFVLAFLGGMIGGLFYGLGQVSKFQCGRCGGIFYSHTATSRIFFVLCIVTYSAVVALVAYGIWSGFTRH